MQCVGGHCINLSVSVSTIIDLFTRLLLLWRRTFFLSLCNKAKMEAKTKQVNNQQ